MDIQRPASARLDASESRSPARRGEISQPRAWPGGCPVPPEKLSRPRNQPPAPVGLGSEIISNTKHASHFGRWADGWGAGQWLQDIDRAIQSSPHGTSDGTIEARSATSQLLSWPISSSSTALISSVEVFCSAGGCWMTWTAKPGLGLSPSKVALRSARPCLRGPCCKKPFRADSVASMKNNPRLAQARQRSAS